MAAVILLTAAGIVYCAAYFVYCIRSGAPGDAVGAALLTLLLLAALLFCALP